MINVIKSIIVNSGNSYYCKLYWGIGNNILYEMVSRLTPPD